MKKIAFILAVLLFAAPALAQTTVTITAEQVGTTDQVEIKYSADPNLPRAFGLDITVDYGVITDCTPAMVGECTVSVKGFGIFPGTIVIDVDGNVTDDGTPVAPSDDPGALGGLGTTGITVEMGSLYVDGNEPPLEGVLCTITVTENCTVDIAGNAARCGVGSDPRGVVMVDWTEVPAVLYEPGEVVLDCFPSAHPDYDEWVLVGEPDSWCFPRQCHGDADGLEESYGPGGMFKAWVGVNDITVLLDGFRKTYGGDPDVDTWIAADFDHAEESYGPGGMFKARVGVDDIAVLLAYFRQTVPTDCLDIP